MCLMVASLLCSKGQTTRIEYIGGCANGDVIGPGDVAVGRAVTLDASDSFEFVSWLSARFGGRARCISGSGLVRRLSARKDDAEDLSDRRLDLPVSAALVRE